MNDSNRADACSERYSLDELFRDFCRFLGMGASFGALSARFPSSGIEDAVDAFWSYLRAGGVLPSDALSPQQFHYVAEQITGVRMILYRLNSLCDAELAKIDLRRASAEVFHQLIALTCVAEIDTSLPIVVQWSVPDNDFGRVPVLIRGSFSESWILLLGVERGTRRVVCWDPLGLHSHLDQLPQLRARIIPGGEFYRTVDLEPLCEVVSAALMPLEQ